MVEPAPTHQNTLDDWSGSENHHTSLAVPATINWKTVRDVYEFQPESYEELVAMKCVEPSTVRGLSFVAELIYGERASGSDPVWYSFAFGGKDGVLFPVDRRTRDEAVNILKTGIGTSDLKRDQKFKALQRLRLCVPPIPKDWMDTQGLG